MKKILLLTITLFSILCSANHQEIDAISAVVDDEIITSSDLSRTINEEKIIGNNTITNENALKLMIEESILAQYAKKSNIIVSKKELESTLESFVQGHNHSIDSFKAVLKEQGITIDEFKTKLERQMLAIRVIASLMTKAEKPAITDIEAFWNKHKYDRIMVAFNDWVMQDIPKNSKWKQKKPTVVASTLLKALPDEYQNEFKKKLFANEYGPIKTENGYHMVEVTGWQGSVMPKQYAANMLMMQAIEKSKASIVKKLRSNFYVKVYK